jgi:putative transcriptional regulator
MAARFLTFVQTPVYAAAAKKLIDDDRQREIRTMKAARKKIGRTTGYGDRLIASLEQALAIERGEAAPAAVRSHVITARDTSARPAPKYRPGQVRKIRASVKLSQAVFAATLNVSPETVRAWEQGKKRPGGPAARLLELAEKDPRWVLGAVHFREPK